MARKLVSTALGSHLVHSSMVALLTAVLATAIILGATDSAKTVQAQDSPHAEICEALITGAVTPDLLRSECAILLDVKDTLRGTASLNWGADVAFKDWDGITASVADPDNPVYAPDTQVSEIDLSGLGLNGEIPPELGSLTALTVLSLWDNELTGTIPPELGNLTSVTTLSLSENQLTGSIPSALGGLSSVRNLYLRTNQLTGAIPAELGNLSSLVQLSLSQNQLTGTIPSELGSLSSRLTHLYLNENQLSGTIPSELGDLTDMVVLNLSHNQLTGEIPTELGGLGRGRNSNGTYNNEYNLTYLNLGHNKLSGSVPNELTTQTVQTHLYLNDNHLSGNLETDLSGLPNMTALTHLHLDQNQFEGYVPSTLGNDLFGLKELTLHGNDFILLTYDSSGTVPNLANSTGLQYLTLDEYLIPNGNGITYLETTFGEPYFEVTLYPYPLEITFDTTVGANSRSTTVFLELPDDPTPAYADADGTYVSLRYDPEAEYHASAAAATLPSGAMLASDPVYFEVAVHFLDDAGSPIVGGRLSEPAVVCIQDNEALASPQLFGLTEGSSMWRHLPTGTPALTPLASNPACGQTRDLSAFVTGASTSDAPSSETAVVQPAKREVTSDGDTFRAVVEDQSIVLSVPPGTVESGQSLDFTIQKAEGPSPSGFTVSGSSEIIEINLPDGVEPGANITVCMARDEGLSGEQSLLHLGDGPDARWTPLPKPFIYPENYPASGWVCGFTRDFSKFTVALVDPGTLGPLTYIKSIEPSIRGATVSQGDVIRLRFDIYGRQGILNNDLAEDHVFAWDDGGAGGRFRSTDRPNTIIYTAPMSPGRHTVTVASPDGACLSGDDAEDRCSATFTITVRRLSAVTEERPAPKNPVGEIPAVLVDVEGRQYEVFTPEDGGTFEGGDVTLSAGPGVVPNLEIVGVRVDVGDSASNVGMSHQRYSLAGMWHEVRAVDADESPVSGYVLQAPLSVCIPLPPELSSNISDVALVSSNADGSLTIHSGSVRITTSGTSVCGGLGTLPATLAVGRMGSPADLPTPTPDPDEIVDPDTGGGAPSAGVLVLLMVVGTAAVVVVGTRMRRIGV